MKLKRLDLSAFGPFTGRCIEFGADMPGLHIIFGSNEAGKSSSLRALKALLYGFPRQTSDNFVHSYAQLLVGGTLENEAGEKLTFQRRKKRIGDLVDGDGNPLEIGVLSPFIHGIEPEIFESLYGIDHDALVRGGEDILNQKGDIGQALFSAGAGISSLNAVIDKLDREAADLFKPAGQLPRINKAIRRYKALQKEVKASSLTIKAWKDHHLSLNNAVEARSRLEKEREDKNQELIRLDRLHQAVPELAVLKSRRQQLRALGDMVPLAPGFAEMVQQVNRELREVNQQLDRDRRRMDHLLDKRHAVSFNKTLLLQAEQVDDFHQRLGAYRKGLKDRPERNGMRISLRREAARLLKEVRSDLTLEGVEALRPLLSKKRLVQSLISRHEAIHQQLKAARRQRKAAGIERREIEKIWTGLPQVQSPAGITQAMQPAQKLGDIDAQLEKRQNAVDQTRNACHAELKRIGIWHGDLDRLLELPLPLPETVQRYEKRFDAMDDDKRRMEKERQHLQHDLKNAQADMRKAAYSGDIPTEAALNRARAKREQGWQLIRRLWLHKDDVTAESHRYDPDRPLGEAYESHVAQADLVADRLRREADRVAGAASLRARMETLEQAMVENHRDFEKCDRQGLELNEAWTREWQPAGITPLSPNEMRRWLSEWDKLRFKVGEMVKQEHGIALDLQRRRATGKALKKALVAMGEQVVDDGERLGPVLMLAEAVSERLSKTRAEYEILKERRQMSKKTVHQAEQAVHSAQQAMVEWQEQWRKAVSAMGPPEEIDTLDALERLENLQHCFGNLKDADDLQKRIDGIDRDNARLDTQVRTVAETVAPELAGVPTDQAVLKLRSMLSQARKDVALYEELSNEIESLQEEISTAQKKQQALHGQEKELLRKAGCRRAEELAAVIEKFAKHQRLQEKISDTQASLAKIGAGVGIEVLAQQASAVNVDALPGMMAELRSDIEGRINPEINRHSQVIGEEHMTLAAMDGSAKAADAAEEMEAVLAALRRYTERYITLKLASRILQREIERYREEHQGPVLTIASDYFSRMTLGSFTGLRTDVDDKGAPILVGVRPDNRRLTVDTMSSGTRDQLFLSLRLATLAWRLETNEPMPFIVDDILINFDDDRSEATLKVLAELSKKNQVILFTHHAQIVDTAKGIASMGNIHIHML
jgi:uncharacterized protein YhaN